MKKVWAYIALIIFEIALGLTYGFVLRNFMPVELLFVIAFAFPFFVLFICCKSRKDKGVKFSGLLFSSWILTAVAISVFFYGNQLNGEFIGEYNVVVQHLNGKGGRYATFITPAGTEGDVTLHDYRPITFDDDYVDVGDTIRVREYKGLFNEYYYVFVKEIH